MNTMITVGDYLLTRLNELGVKHLFGVPGDYNLFFLDQVVEHKGITWVGNCNELNAAYAADGYARISGIGAVLTTFGVGELSAINGIAGSYAEYVPVVKIVGAPTLPSQTSGSLLHHSFASGDFKIFAEMYSKVTTAQVSLTPENAAESIDHALQLCWIKKRPVYISVPSDVVSAKIPAPTHPLDLNYPKSNESSVAEVVERVQALLAKSKNPVVLLDICAVRHPMKLLIEKFLAQTNIPFATMNMGKGLLPESNPNFIGNYNGAYSTPGVQERVENSDCIISFGTIFSDFNTGGFTSAINANTSVEIHSDHVKLHQAYYADVYFNALLPALIQHLQVHFNEKNNLHPVVHCPKPTTQSISQDYFWARMGNFFQKEDIVVAETGTSMFGLMGTPLPDGATFISQPLWASIGYSVGALLGAAIANPNRRALLFVGDGSFQLTAQEVSTIMRNKLNPILFVLNNDGYTIERVIHGEKMVYNDIQPWNYAALPAVFGKNIWTARVSNQEELEQILLDTKKHNDKTILIEVMMDRDDCPEMLRKIGQACAERNVGN